MQRITSVIHDIYTVTVALFRVMIPTLIVVKIAEMLGVVELLSTFAAPVVTLMGLPLEMAIVLTTTALTNPYAGLMVLAATPVDGGLTIAQTSIIASFMLFAHGLPVEAAISRQAGIKGSVVVILRVLTAILYGILLHWGFSITGLLQDAAILNLPEFTPNSDLLSWVRDQVTGLVFVFAVIVVLMVFLEILRVLRVEQLLRIIVRPLLRPLQMSDAASTIIVVGLTLGLGFGGGLMIKDVQQGKVGPKDAVGALIVINLFHSVIEDTTVMMLLGPSVFVILILRGLFVFALAYVILGIITRMGSDRFERLFVNKHAFPGPKPQA